MTAVERQNTPAAFMTERQAESPTSRFTAVNNINGRDSNPSSGAPKPPHVNGAPRRESVDRQQGQPRIPTPGQEKLTITTQVSPREERTPPENGAQQAPPPRPSPATALSENESSHKRKRSSSQEPSAASPYTQHGNQAAKDRTSPAGSPGLSPGTGSGASREPGVMAPPPSIPRSSYPDTHAPAYSYAPHEAPEQTAGQWYGHQSQDHAAAAQPANPDDRLREALARDAQGSGGDPHAGGYGGSPTEGQFQEGYPDNRTLAQVQQDDRKKRKRNFSNRTKTGCMTCRRRKKKCDETRPECNNCVRGGFVCNGYPSRASWTKPGAGEPKPALTPLESKGAGYEPATLAPPPTYGAPPPPQYALPPVSLNKREPLPSYRGQQPPRVDTQQPPSHLGIDDRLGPQGMPNSNSPDNRLSAVSYSQPSPFPTPVSAHPNAFGNTAQHEYIKGRRPPFHDNERHEAELNSPQSGHPHGLPHINILNPPQVSSPHPLTQSTSIQDAQAAARLALSHPASRATSSKQNMLMGETDFYPFDRELVAERERCNASCWRFNTSTNPNTGVSPEERARLFQNILQPRDSVNLSPAELSPISVTGRVGRDVVVEAPFTCDYGYNINIGNEVAIGKNCTILDSCEVSIGDKTIIGPNVNIYTEYLDTDPRKRMGSKGPHKAKRVIIEDSVWIGGNVTILPGVTIKRGATVGAGSVVTRDVPSWTVVAGRKGKAIVVRGIASYGQ